MWKKLLRIWREDDLLQKAWEKSYQMLAIDQEMFLEAVHILRESEGARVTQAIREKDKIVNKYEQEVRRDVVMHCTLQGSGALPGGMALVSIIIDIERIGDYTKNIVELAASYPDKLHGKKFEDDLKRVEDAVKDFFVRTRSCLEASDVHSARESLEKYIWVNSLCDKCLMELVQEKDKEMTVSKAVALSMYFRWLKRINSHLRNITTSVVNPFDRIGFEPEEKKE